MRKILTLFLFFSLPAFAQPQSINLERLSQNFNQELPMDYDPRTKLISTNVENGEMVFNFEVIRTSMFDWSLTAAKAEALRKICGRELEDTVLGYGHNVVYRYRAVTGETMGMFTVKSDPCDDPR